MGAYPYVTIVTAGYAILQIFSGLAISRLRLRRFIIFHIFSAFIFLLLAAIAAVLGVFAKTDSLMSVSVVFAILVFFSAVLQVGTGVRLYLSRPKLRYRHLIIALVTFGLAMFAALFAIL